MWRNLKSYQEEKSITRNQLQARVSKGTRGQNGLVDVVLVEVNDKKARMLADFRGVHKGNEVCRTYLRGWGCGRCQGTGEVGQTDRGHESLAAKERDRARSPKRASIVTTTGMFLVVCGTAYTQKEYPQKLW